MLSRASACLGNHGFTKVHTDGFPRRNKRSQQAKKVPGTAANVEYVDSGAESQRGKEILGGRASAFKKASAGSVEKIHKEAWIFGSIDLSPRVREGSGRHQGLRQSILPKARQMKDYTQPVEAIDWF
jgi:hypothetical protein